MLCGSTSKSVLNELEMVSNKAWRISVEVTKPTSKRALYLVQVETSAYSSKTVYWILTKFRPIFQYNHPQSLCILLAASIFPWRRKYMIDTVNIAVQLHDCSYIFLHVWDEVKPPNSILEACYWLAGQYEGGNYRREGWLLLTRLHDLHSWSNSIFHCLRVVLEANHWSRTIFFLTRVHELCSW